MCAGEQLSFDDLRKCPVALQAASIPPFVYTEG